MQEQILSITLNIQESFYNQGKLGKAFFHLSTRKGFRSSRKGFVNLFSNLGKLLKILGKVSFQNFPKLPWERKGKEKLSVLTEKTLCERTMYLRINYVISKDVQSFIYLGQAKFSIGSIPLHFAKFDKLCTVYILARTVSSQLLLYTVTFASFWAGLGQKSRVLCVLLCPNGPYTRAGLL